MASEGTPDQGSDRALVLAFKGGNEGAYEEIFKRYQPRVHGVCWRMLGTTADADEATQETFLRAYQALPRFNGRFYLGAWLARIATNVCVDHLRSKARSNLVALPEDRDDLITEQGPEEIVVGEHPRLENAIRDIQPLHASALALRAVEGLSHEEIAGHLQMTPSQVKALLHRARCSLRKAWSKAEGWAWAPLFGLRHLMNDRTTADAGRLATVTPSAAPFLMERVATSAMIVAVALSGLPSSPEGAAVATPTTRAPAAVGSFDEKSAQVIAPSAALGAQPGADDAAEQAPAPATVVDEAQELAAEIQKALKKKEEETEKPPKDSGGKSQSPVGPSASEGKKVVKKIKHTATEVLGENQP